MASSLSGTDLRIQITSPLTTPMASESANLRSFTFQRRWTCPSARDTRDAFCIMLIFASPIVLMGAALFGMIQAGIDAKNNSTSSTVAKEAAATAVAATSIFLACCLKKNLRLFCPPIEPPPAQRQE